MAEEMQPAETAAAGNEAPPEQPAVEATEAEPFADRAAELEKVLAVKQQELEAQEQKAREYLEGWQRERASFENFRKRKAREMEEAGAVAKVNLVRSILPALDNLERALADESADADVVRKGVRMTCEQLLAALEQHGVKPIESVGMPFDPNMHDAVDTVSDTEQESDTVVEDLQRGFMLGERLVRPAKVRVAR